VIYFDYDVQADDLDANGMIRSADAQFAQGARHERKRIERHLREQGLNVQLPDSEQQSQDKKKP